MKSKIFYVVISVLMLLMVFVQPVLAEVNNIPDEDKVIVKQKDGKTSQAEYIYTGKKIMPELVVTRYLDGTVVDPSEYVVTYDDDCDKCGVHIIMFNYPKTGYTTGWHYYVVPGKTKKISMSAKNGAVTISWEAVPGATHYRFYMYNDSGRTELWWDENTIAAPKLSRTLTNLKAGKKYKIGIMALPSEDYMPTNQMKTFEFTVPTNKPQTTSKPTTSQDNTSSDASSVTSDVSSETEPTTSTPSATVDKPTTTVQPKEEKNNNVVIYIVVGAVVAAGAAAAVVVYFKKKK